MRVKQQPGEPEIAKNEKRSDRPGGGGTEDTEQVQTVAVKAALALLHFYKTAISPLLPPSCRFVPTCSVYAAEAYQTLGFTKGTLLTVWRLLRCNPWGNSGYDPVRWPPPGWSAGSLDEP